MMLSYKREHHFRAQGLQHRSKIPQQNDTKNRSGKVTVCCRCWFPAGSSNSSKTSPNPIYNATRKIIKNKHSLSLILGPQWRQIVHGNLRVRSSRGALGDHTGPWRPKGRSRAHPGHHFYDFWDSFWKTLV